jgi:hypothetical protein
LHVKEEGSHFSLLLGDSEGEQNIRIEEESSICDQCWPIISKMVVRRFMRLYKDQLDNFARSHVLALLAYVKERTEKTEGPNTAEQSVKKEDEYLLAGFDALDTIP